MLDAMLEAMLDAMPGMHRNMPPSRKTVMAAEWEELLEPQRSWRLCSQDLRGLGPALETAKNLLAIANPNSRWCQFTSARCNPTDHRIHRNLPVQRMLNPISRPMLATRPRFYQNPKLGIPRNQLRRIPMQIGKGRGLVLSFRLLRFTYSPSEHAKT